MAESQEKVRPISPGVGAPGEPQVPEDFMTRSFTDMGRIALFVSLLSVVLVVIFFFGLNQNISGVSGEVKQLAAAAEQIDAINAKLGTIEEKVALFEALPDQARRMMYATMLQELSQRVGFLSNVTEDGDQTAKLVSAMQLLQEVQQGFEGKETPAAPEAPAAQAAPAAPAAPEAPAAPAAQVAPPAPAAQEGAAQ